MYDTFNVSPDTTAREPPENEPAEYRIPAPPLLAVPLACVVHINAPNTVPLALMLNEVVVVALLPAEAADHETVVLFDPVYDKNSNQPA